MIIDDFINHALENLNKAGIDKQYLREDVIELISVFAKQDHDRTPRHETIDLFNSLARFENLPSKEAINIVKCNPELLRPYQKYLLECFKESDFVPIPDYARNMSAMWRFATYEHLISDTVYHGGTIMASVLSMAYKPNVVVEMGVHGGFTNLLLCRLNPSARVYAVDINSKMPDADLPICFAALINKVNNLTLSIMPSWEFDMTGKVDLCFIDADHIGDAPYKDSVRAWENRNINGDWCIAWDDYHPNNPDVYNAVNKFVSEVGFPLQNIGSWVLIGTKPIDALKEFI